MHRPTLDFIILFSVPLLTISGFLFSPLNLLSANGPLNCGVGEGRPKQVPQSGVGNIQRSEVNPEDLNSRQGRGQVSDSEALIIWTGSLSRCGEPSAAPGNNYVP